MAIPQKLGSLPEQLLPKTVTGPIFDKAQEQSVILSAANTIEIDYGTTDIPVTISRPEAGYVGHIQPVDPETDMEGGQKPVSEYNYGVQTIRPIKLAVIVVVSEEFQAANVAGMYDRIAPDLSFAIARGIDLAVIHGSDPLSGGLIPGVTYLDQTTNRVALGTNTAEEGGLWKDIADGWELVVNEDYDPTDFIADPRFRPVVMGATNMFGQPIAGQGMPNLTGSVNSLMGLPVHYGKGVSGRVGAHADTGVRAYIGDFNQLRVGFARQFTLRTSNQATITLPGVTDPVSLWQNNLVALLAEVVFGWVVGDAEAFTAYEGTPVVSS